MTTPQPIDPSDIDLSDILEAAEQYIERLASDYYNEDEGSDLEHAVFEAVMTTVYGPDVWEWVNERLR